MLQRDPLNLLLSLILIFAAARLLFSIRGMAEAAKRRALLSEWEQQLTEVDDYETLLESLSKFLQINLSITLWRVYLGVWDEPLQTYERIVEWRPARPGLIPHSTLPARLAPFLPAGSSNLFLPDPISGSAKPNDDQKSRIIHRGKNEILFPLRTAKVMVGFLYLYLAPDSAIRAGKVGLLESMRRTIGLTVQRIKLRKAALDSARQAEADRKQLARHLHDTISHDLAYLILSLDRLADNFSNDHELEIFREIKRIRDIADQSYRQVRSSLENLRGHTPADLVSAIQDCVDSVGERTKIKVDYVCNGSPKHLPLYSQRQILYIIREILMNSGKHAGVEQVKLSVSWSKDSLTITASDDGTGFDPPGEVTGQGKHGLSIIQECAEEIGAALTVTSSRDSGTHFNLRVPIAS